VLPAPSTLSTQMRPACAAEAGRAAGHDQVGRFEQTVCGVGDGQDEERQRQQPEVEAAAAVRAENSTIASVSMAMMPTVNH
jgi:hypothetical protein